jgi:hypothetical protein
MKVDSVRRVEREILVAAIGSIRAEPFFVNARVLLTQYISQFSNATKYFSVYFSSMG